MDEKKKKIVVVIIIATCALAFAIFWKATEFSRHRLRVMNSIDEDLNEYRTSGSALFLFHSYDDLMDDSKFQEFLINRIGEMYENKEYAMLQEFLSEFEKDGNKFEFMTNTVGEEFGKIDNVSDALSAFQELKKLEFYGNNISLNAETGILADYIKENGTQQISMKAGEGFYADKEDENTWKRVGIEGSALYDATNTEYWGDFVHIREYGVELNRSTYEEESYSRDKYYFRDQQIPFSPLEGACVLSGNYLFKFDDDWNLLGAVEVK